MGAAPTMTMSIYDELVSALKTDGKYQEKTPADTNRAYIEKIVVSVGQIAEETWNKLSEPAQQWFNTAAQTVNSLQPVQDCPGYIPEPETVVAATDTAKNGSSKTEEQKPAGKRGVMARLRELALLHTDWTDAQLSDELVKEGWDRDKIKADTVWLCRTEVKNVLKAAETVGYAFTKK